MPIRREHLVELRTMLAQRPPTAGPAGNRSTPAGVRRSPAPRPSRPASPEDPFPAALEDSVHAYRWLTLDHGTPPHRIGLIGDSAGGNLVIATLVQLRDIGEPLPAAAVCVCLTRVRSGPHRRVDDDARIARPDDPAGIAAAVRGRLPRRRRSENAARLAAIRCSTWAAAAADRDGLGGDAARRQRPARREGEGGRRRRHARGMGRDVHVWHLFSDRLEDGRKAIARVGEFLWRHIS
ncbi:MAG: alpha/beta hydrolase fold domain-containing protein [Rhizobiales bacterium]|nr:alpha/beta hydrolase fold domain-containing protein [Hyphomicrobiales bacterium]